MEVYIDVRTTTTAIIYFLNDFNGDTAVLAPLCMSRTRPSNANKIGSINV